MRWRLWFAVRRRLLMENGKCQRKKPFRQEITKRVTSAVCTFLKLCLEWQRTLCAA